MYNPYDDKYNLWSESILWGGLFKNNIEYLGNKEFYIKDKFQRIYRYGRITFYFYVQDIEERIRIPVEVREEEYLLYEVGKPYRVLGVVKLKKQDIILVTNATNEKDAVKEILKKSWKEFFIMLIILIAFFASIFYPFLK